MEFTDNTSRRSVLRTFFASLAAGVGLSDVAQAQTPTTDTGKRTSTDNQPAGDKPPLFSGWVTYGNLVFVAGKGHHTPGDITVHTTSVLDQIEAELKKATTHCPCMRHTEIGAISLQAFRIANKSRQKPGG